MALNEIVWTLFIIIGKPILVALGGFGATYLLCSLKDKFQKI